MSLMDEIKEEYGIIKEPLPSGSITPPLKRKHTTPYLHRVNQGHLSVIDYGDYNELIKQDYLKQQTVMSTFVFDIKYLIKFIDEGLYGYSETPISSEELIRNMVIRYPYIDYPTQLPDDPMLKSCYLALASELTQKFTTVGIYNLIPEHQLTPNGYLIVRVPAILMHDTVLGGNQHE